MNLKKQIRKILLEESKLPSRVRRRLGMLDHEVELRIRTTYGPNKICRFGSGEELLDDISEAVITQMYWKNFDDIDDSSNEWGEMYFSMMDYLKNKYGEKIKEYYHINCGD